MLALLTVNLPMPTNPPNRFAHKEGIWHDYLFSHKKQFSNIEKGHKQRHDGTFLKGNKHDQYFPRF